MMQAISLGEEKKQKRCCRDLYALTKQVILNKHILSMITSSVITNGCLSVWLLSDLWYPELIIDNHTANWEPL